MTDKTGAPNRGFANRDEDVFVDPEHDPLLQMARKARPVVRWWVLRDWIAAHRDRVGWGECLDQLERDFPQVQP